MYWLFLALLWPTSTQPYQQVRTWGISNSHLQEALRPWPTNRVVSTAGHGTIWVLHAPWLRPSILGYTIIQEQDCIVLVRYKYDASTTAHELGHCIGQEHTETGLMAGSGPSGFLAMEL